MTSRDFCYWLQGYFELSGAGDNALLAGKQLEQVKAHLAMVFKHEIDPSMGPKPHQDALSHLHSSGGGGGGGAIGLPDGVLIRC